MNMDDVYAQEEYIFMEGAEQTVPYDSPLTSIPVRLCCGKRHWGVVCPDGKVMCCICFERVSQSDLNVLPNGKKEDVCKACAKMEQSVCSSNHDAQRRDGWKFCRACGIQLNGKPNATEETRSKTKPEGKMK